jgi:branched-chain amino acid transport system permease protein
MTFQSIVNGVLLGGLYTTLALGLSLVFSVMRLVNVAHGDLITGGAYLVYYATTTLGLHVDPLVALVFVIPVVFVVGYGLQRTILTPLLRTSMEAPLVATFGLSIVIEALLTSVFTGNTVSLNASYEATGISILGTDVRVVYLIGFGIAAILVVVTHLVLSRTRFGRALRATSTDPDTAATMGVNVDHQHAVAFGIAAGMAAVGGVIVGVAFSLTPTEGTSLLTMAFAVVVLGGLGSVAGTMLAAVLIGITQALASQWLGGQYSDLTVYLLLVVILVVRPTGFFGRAEIA